MCPLRTCIGLRTQRHRGLYKIRDRKLQLSDRKDYGCSRVNSPLRSLKIKIDFQPQILYFGRKLSGRLTFVVREIGSCTLSPIVTEPLDGYLSLLHQRELRQCICIIIKLLTPCKNSSHLASTLLRCIMPF